MNRIQLLVHFTLAMVLFSQAPGSYAKKLMRWEDDQGNIYYSDKVTPAHVQHRRETLNQNARVIDVVEAKKSKQQLQLEARLEALRKEQEKIIAKQKTQDKVLLSTYRNLEDIELALKNKINSVKSQQKVAESNVNGLQKQLTKQQKQAAAYERNGNQAPKKLIDNIKSTKKQIKLSQAEVKKHKIYEQEVYKFFAANKKRFQFLTGADSNTEQIIDKSATTKAADQLGLFSCPSEAQCALAWDAARQFIQQHSTVTIDFDSESLIMGGQPLSDRDLSLSVSKMKRKNKAPDIFLDIRCRESSLGRELCKSHKATNLRTSFRPYIISVLEN